MKYGSKLESNMSQSHQPLLLKSDGFCLSDSHPVCVRWASIRRILAYKLDLLTTDEVRIIFEQEGAPTIEISEEQPGFEQLMTVVDSHFRFPDDWWASLKNPPFVTNETTLFERS